MRIHSIQVGMPKTIVYRGKEITTGIFKDQVLSPVMLRTLGVEGDGQADLKVHGGRDKALYAYSRDAYAWWQEHRPQSVYPNGAFGENLTIESLNESQIFIDDIFELGTAIVQVTEPRFPCSKLAAKFDDSTIVKTFMHSERPGIYFRVLQEGWLAVGDMLQLTQRETGKNTVREVFLKKKK